MTKLDQIVQRAREAQSHKEWQVRELAAAVVEMAEELEGVAREEEYVTRIEKANLTIQQRIQEIESQRDQLQNWLDNIAAAFLHKANPGFTYTPQTLGDEIMARIGEMEARLATQGYTIMEYQANVTALTAQLATARKLIEKRRTKPSAARWDDWDEEADQFLKALAALDEHYRLQPEQEGKDAKTISDGFGSAWSVTCPTCGKDTMQVVRPGKVQCGNCE